MDETEHKADFGAWLRRTWNALMRVADVMERTPMDDVFDRLGWLEREMANLKKGKAAG
jgi:hypothetical protein